ncbi:MAG: class I SAM-dependent methyltransferase [Deltaproteobacteria bacterium]
MLVIYPGVEHESADFDLDPVVASARWQMEERHFWHAARNRWIELALQQHGVRPPARVLDVGCGSGAVAGALSRRGYSVVGIDTAEVLVRKAHERVPQATFIVGSVAQLDPKLEPFDAVGFFDVLEHLEDPLSLVRQALAHARPGALVIATVPSLQSLYSAVDELAGHKRRYELGELAQTFSLAGVTQVREHGMFRLLLPVLRRRRATPLAPTDKAAQRRLLLADMRIPAFPLNQLLRLACSLEARFGFSGAQGKVGPTLLVLGRVSGREL